MKFFKWILALLLALCAFGAVAQTVRVESISGSGTITQGARKVAVARGQELPVGATLSTGRQSLVMLRFEDGQTVALAENTTFQVASFVFDPAKPKQGGAVLNVIQGGMRVLTGELGKANPGSISIKTPTTSVGIRGSDIIVTVTINGGVPQVSVQVISGAASVGSAAVPVGSVAVATGASVNLSVTVTVSSTTALSGTAAALNSQLSVINMTVNVTVGAVPGATTASSGTPVGTVQNLKGFATVTSPDGSIRLATQNMQLFTGDTVVTTAGSQIAVQFTASGCVAGIPGASMASVAASTTCRSLAAAIQPVSMATPSVAAAGGAATGASATATASAGATAGTSVASTAAGTTAAGSTAAGATAAGTTAGTTVAGAGATGAAGSSGLAVAGGTSVGGSTVATGAGGLAGVTQGAITATTGSAVAVATSPTFSFAGLIGAVGTSGGVFAATVVVTVANDKLQNASGA